MVSICKFFHEQSIALNLLILLCFFPHNIFCAATKETIQENDISSEEAYREKLKYLSKKDVLWCSFYQTTNPGCSYNEILRALDSFKKSATSSAASNSLSSKELKSTSSSEGASSSEPGDSRLDRLSVEDQRRYALYKEQHPDASFDEVFVAIHDAKKTVQVRKAAESSISKMTVEPSRNERDVVYDYISDYKAYLNDRHITCCFIERSPKLDARTLVTITCGYPDTLKQQIKIIKFPIPSLSRIFIINGAPGVGKSMLATILAIETKKPLLVVRMPSVETEWKASESLDLERILEPILHTTHSWVVLLDELDYIDKKCSDGERNDNPSKALQLVLDQNRNPNLILVATTNNVERMPDSFIQRFSKSLFEIPLPDFYVRKRIAQLYFSQECIQCSDEVLNFLAENTGGYFSTGGLSGRSIKEIVGVIFAQLIYERMQTLPERDFSSAELTALLRKLPLRADITHVKKGIAFVVHNLKNAGVPTSELHIRFNSIIESKHFWPTFNAIKDTCIALHGMYIASAQLAISHANLALQRTAEARAGREESRSIERLSREERSEKRSEGEEARSIERFSREGRSEKRAESEEARSIERFSREERSEKRAEGEEARSIERLGREQRAESRSEREESIHKRSLQLAEQQRNIGAGSLLTNVTGLFFPGL